jgi:hypothetical protein
MAAANNQLRRLRQTTREPAGQSTGGFICLRGTAMFRAIARLTLLAVGLGTGVLGTSVLGTGAAEAAALTTACHPEAANIRHAGNAATLQSGAAGDLLCVDGEPTAVNLELHQTTVSQALVRLLGAYNVSVRSATALSEIRDGTYKGTLRHVISRLLDGYDFIISREGANLHVVILSRKGERAIAAPAPIVVSENIERPPVHGSREH